MNVYSILTPQFALAILHRKDGILYHVSDPENPAYVPNQHYNSEVGVIQTQRLNYYVNDIINVPLCASCDPKDVKEFAEQQIECLEGAIQRNKQLELGAVTDVNNVNIFVCHSDLNIAPVYMSFCAKEGIGKNLWAR